MATSDSAFGQGVLQQLFKLVDADRSGYIDKEELSAALSSLGFTWLKEKQVNGIFKRADANGDGVLDVHEFVSAFSMHREALRFFMAADANGDGAHHDQNGGEEDREEDEDI